MSLMAWNTATKNTTQSRNLISLFQSQNKPPRCSQKHVNISVRFRLVKTMSSCHCNSSLSHGTLTTSSSSCGLYLYRKSHRRRVIAKADRWPKFTDEDLGLGFGEEPQNDIDNNGGRGRLFFNIAMFGTFAYLTVTGKLGWVFDTIATLWLLATILPLALIAAFFWFVGREMLQGDCPNCGNQFQVFNRSDLKEGYLECPYCSQQFEYNVDFTRDDSKYTTGGFEEFMQAFENRNDDRSGQEPQEMIVDVEAEVMDRN